jgi:hypothetical protein
MPPRSFGALCPWRAGMGDGNPVQENLEIRTSVMGCGAQYVRGTVLYFIQCLCLEAG